MKRHPNKTIVTAVLAMTVSLFLVSTAQARPTPLFTPTHVGTADNAAYLHALQVRSQALNEKFGLGDSATAPAKVTGGFDLQEGLIGSAALFATILVIGAAIIVTERRQMRPLGV